MAYISQNAKQTATLRSRGEFGMTDRRLHQLFDNNYSKYLPLNQRWSNHNCTINLYRGNFGI